MPWRRGAAVLGALGALAASILLLLSFLEGGPEFRVEEATWLAVGPESRELREDDTVQVGSQIRLRFRADRDLHVYVLNEDEKGERYLLFPLPGGESQNPLGGGTDHTLPGRMQGAEASWVVTSAGGKEWFFLVASRRPLPSLEDLAPRAAAGPVSLAVAYPRVGTREVGEVLRGVGGVKLERRASSQGDKLLLARYIESMDVAPAASREPKDGLWVRKLSLRNP